jgi:7-cyano-7-deazaguanine synthase
VGIVTLVSGGLDSALMAALTKEQGIEQWPIWVDYGQRNREAERAACHRVLKSLGLREPTTVSVPGIGAFLPTGLTNPSMDIVRDAFLPCRNLLFLTLGAAHAHRVSAGAVAIGLLDESRSLFPDQTQRFLDETERTLSTALGRKLQIAAPLMAFSKADVVALAESRGIKGTYSCHAGSALPCGVCIACREYAVTEA